MNEPAGALPLPRPPPPPGFDRAAFDATLREVDRAAVSVRTLFDGERTTYLRADGIFVLAMASLLFPFSESLGFGWPELWLPSGPFLALGLILTVFPTWWQRAMTRLLPGKWVLPPVETGPPTPDLSRSVRVIGQLWKDWDNLQRFS
ncbi:MAG TPA: hypothetical protein VMH38_01305, partial [Thermoplasmata archaeon]|nr:hypothetical protein [Thermoplasmata archaeon]